MELEKLRRELVDLRAKKYQLPAWLYDAEEESLLSTIEVLEELEKVKGESEDGL